MIAYGTVTRLDAETLEIAVRCPACHGIARCEHDETDDETTVTDTDPFCTAHSHDSAILREADYALREYRSRGAAEASVA